MSEPRQPKKGQLQSYVVVQHDFGDTELVVRRHPDGRFTLDLPIDGPLVMTTDQFRDLLEKFAAVGRLQGSKV